MKAAAFPFKACPLPYASDTLEPFLSEEQLRSHYQKHYIKNITRLNDSLKGYPNYWRIPLFCLLSEAKKIPSDVRQEVLEAGGAVFNHELCFASMSPFPTNIPKPLMDKIEENFSSAEKCVDEIFLCAASVVGSGYAMLAADRSGALKIISAENDDTSYLRAFFPLIAVDLWEHAYYIKYKNDRFGYMREWAKHINWSFAAAQLKASF